MNIFKNKEIENFLQSNFSELIKTNGYHLKDNLIYIIKDKILVGIHLETGDDYKIRPRAFILPLAIKTDYIFFSISTDMRYLINSNEWLRLGKGFENFNRGIQQQFEDFLTKAFTWLSNLDSPQEILDSNLNLWNIEESKFICALMVKNENLINSIGEELIKNLSNSKFDLAQKKLTIINNYLDLLKKGDFNAIDEILEENYQYSIEKLKLI